MDFAALPPEVNSMRMYAGPGTGALLAAAAAWRGLAGELGSAASECQAVLADLTGQGWFGAASEAMAAAAARYADWLVATAASAQQTANRLMDAVSDFEQAFAATVPPPVIAANRSRLAALVASDLAGQNASAIAETEAEYSQMWLQDAAAMYGYAARSAAATTVTPFTAPPPIADPAGAAGQSGAAARATSGGAGDQVSRLLSAIPRALHGLSGAGDAQAAPVDALAPAQSTDPVAQAASYLGMASRMLLPANDTNISMLYGMSQYARNLNIDLDISQATGGRAGFGSGAKALSAAEATAAAAAPRPVAASAGSAGTVGRLAVPPVWSAAVPEVAPVAVAASVAPPAAAPAGHGAAMAGAGLAGLAAGRAGRRRERGDPADARAERIAGRLTGTTEVRHWHVEPGGLKNLLGEVSGQPGVHEVYFDTGAAPEAGPQQGGK